MVWESSHDGSVDLEDVCMDGWMDALQLVMHASFINIQVMLAMLIN